MIRSLDRRRIITLVNEAVAAGGRLTNACHFLNPSIRTIHRWRQSDGTFREDARRAAKMLTPKNKMADVERMRILEVSNQHELASLPPGAIVPILDDPKIRIGKLKHGEGS